MSRHCSVLYKHQTIGNAVRFTIPHNSFPLFSQIPARISISSLFSLFFFFYRRTVGRCTHFGCDSPLITTVTPTTPPQIRFASHNTSIIGLGIQVMLSRSLRVKSDTQLGFVGNKLHSSKQIK